MFCSLQYLRGFSSHILVAGSLSLSCLLSPSFASSPLSSIPAFLAPETPRLATVAASDEEDSPVAAGSSPAESPVLPLAAGLDENLTPPRIGNVIRPSRRSGS